jgi:hypothetical protein
METKMLVVFLTAIPVTCIEHRKAVWFDAVGQARNPKL